MPTLEWIGKEKVINHHQEVPFRTLEKKYTYNAESSENMIIHGDNLLALKSLLPQYEGRVDCIYIDPPYNTGAKEGQWVYSDNVDDPRIKKWLGEVVGSEGEDLSRHDKWLCMMYPRLKLLWKLLRVNGAIFISIDDNEFSRLKLLCDEIFGQNNFIKTFIWYTSGHTDNQDDITSVHEYILCYAKEKNTLCYNAIVDPNVDSDSKVLRDYAENSITKNGYKNPPSIVELPKGFPCEAESLELAEETKASLFIMDVEKIGYITRELTNEYAVKYPIRLDRMNVNSHLLQDKCRVYSGWMNVEKLKQFIKNGCHPIPDGETMLSFYLSKNGVVYYRRTGRKSHYIQTVLENFGTTELNKYMIERMNLKFDYPKPVELIEFILSFFTRKDSIFLDSFAGSGTTAHAVLDLNKQDGGNRKFILVEMMDYAETITAERVKRVIAGYGEGNKAVAGLGGDFSYYELGEPLFKDDKNLNEAVGEEEIRKYVYYMETKQPLEENTADTRYYLGKHNDTAYYFYYEKDKPTTLNREFLATVKTKATGYLIYADICTLSAETLSQNGIVFKKIPRDIKKL